MLWCFSCHTDFPSGDASDVVLDVEDYPPGDYNLTVTVGDVNGVTTSEVVESLSITGLLVPMCGG